MKVVILAGGYGTRIRDVNDDIPKPMIRIGKFPIIWHIMRYYSYFNFKEFIICLGYKGEIIKNYFLNYNLNSQDLNIDFSNRNKVTYLGKEEKLDWKVTLVDTGLNAMTGARVRKIKNYINDENFMITYGDGVGNIDLNLLKKFHKTNNKVLTVTGVRPPGRFGELRSFENIVTEFNEKPQTENGRISGGFFVANKKIFDYLNNDESLVFEDQPMKKLVNEKELVVFNHDGFWHPMDTMREFNTLNDLYKKGKAPWVKW
tara:strand:- start:4263 stop:5039 length:777 start_codon:yes stop_codon:yes gene_type:complete